MSNEKTCLSCYRYDPYCSTDDYHNETCDVTGNPVTKHDSACDAYRRSYKGKRRRTIHRNDYRSDCRFAFVRDKGGLRNDYRRADD